MTEEQKLALMEALDELWVFGADQHPAPARKLKALRAALGLPPPPPPNVPFKKGG